LIKKRTLESTNMASHPKRRPIWHFIADRYGLAADHEKRDRFVFERFKMTWATFDSTLSRGFSLRHEPILRTLCSEVGVAYEADVWLSLEARNNAPSPSLDDIRWGSPPLRSPEQFYDELEQLYAGAALYGCLRVGGVFSSNRTAFDYDDEDLATAPKDPGAGVRFPYLDVFWSRIRQREMTGFSVHVIRNLDRLSELWAALDLMAASGQADANHIYLVPVGADDYTKASPTMGVRVIDHDLSLFSVPAAINGRSAYSSWIRSPQLSAFAHEAIHRAKDGGAIDLTVAPKLAVRQIFEDAFQKLVDGKANPITNYGRLDSFEKVIRMKNLMVEWAEKGSWLPVVA
jgi:hypothetical protein